MKTRMVRVPVDLLHRLRQQFPDLTDVSDTALVLILLRRHLAAEQERVGSKVGPTSKHQTKGGR